MSYFAAIDGKQEGPFTEEELRQKLGSTVTAQTLIWKEGMENWLPLELALPALATVSPLLPAAWKPADRIIRLGAAVIDMVPLFLIGIVAGFMIPFIGAASRNSEGPSPMLIPIIVIIAILFLAVAAVQITMLVKFSQTIGKRLLKIRIYDIQNGQPANWVKTIVLRLIVNALPSMIPFVGGLYGLVDILFIFREDRRCLHDLIAGTVVGTVPAENILGK